MITINNNYLEEILDIINEFKDKKEVTEVIVDINAVIYMINYGYNEEKVKEISQKYIKEITFLREIEKATYFSDPISNNSPEIQILHNLYYVLIRIATLRILKLNNNQFSKEKLISRDYKEVYDLLKNI